MNINIFVTLATSTWRYQGSKSLAEITLGGIEGYVYGEPVDGWIAKHRQQPDRIQLISGESAIEQNLTLLERGRTSAYIEDKMVVQYRAHLNRIRPPWRIAGEASRLPFHIAFSPAKAESVARAQALADLVLSWRKNGKLHTSLNRYGLDDWR